MTQIKAQTLKGFRDFLPKEAKKRQYAIGILRSVFESYGFEPLETPALEYEEILLGKYGEEGDKLMYRFEDNGKRRVALRYDQTVPLARVIAQYQNELVMPFKRYQIQPVWRAENTQKGRFREFLQCDADIVGVDTPLSDAETILITAKAIEKLGFQNYKIIINDRNIFSNLIKRDIFSEKTLQIVIRAIDKIKKIGREKVLEEIVGKDIPSEQATYTIQTIEQMQPTERLQNIFTLLNKLGINETQFEFSPTLARGLDYYTGVIFEVGVEGYTAGSVCGGGRYDNLIGMFMNQGNLPAGRQVPAVGFAFGFDRLIEAMEQFNLFPANLDATTKVLVTIFSPELVEKSLEVYSRLKFTLSERSESKGSNNISTELYLDENTKMDKQMRYANQKNIPHVIIIGPEEAEKNMVTIRDMTTREQKMMTLEEIVKMSF
ncbi:MAG: histidine--tRNA ligase [Candidatus Levybacteria bacterium]|nr:histidine--tRNA ligase [Candidatus Levybacteria bacterium]